MNFSLGVGIFLVCYILLVVLLRMTGIGQGTGGGEVDLAELAEPWHEQGEAPEQAPEPEAMDRQQPPAPDDPQPAGTRSPAHAPREPEEPPPSRIERAREELAQLSGNPQSPPKATTTLTAPPPAPNPEPKAEPEPESEAGLEPEPLEAPADDEPVTPPIDNPPAPATPPRPDAIASGTLDEWRPGRSPIQAASDINQILESPTLPFKLILPPGWAAEQHADGTIRASYADIVEVRLFTEPVERSLNDQARLGVEKLQQHNRPLNMVSSRRIAIDGRRDWQQIIFNVGGPRPYDLYCLVHSSAKGSYTLVISLAREGRTDRHVAAVQDLLRRFRMPPDNFSVHPPERTEGVSF